jgi:hypothetical protein
LDGGTREVAPVGEAKILVGRNDDQSQNRESNRPRRAFSSAYEVIEWGGL